jgi:hypothetical protein
VIQPSQAGAEFYTWGDPPTALPSTNGVYEIYVDTWWAVNEDEQVALYRSSPQCNANEQIARRVAKNIPGCVGVKQIPLVVLRHRCNP